MYVKMSQGGKHMYKDKFWLIRCAITISIFFYLLFENGLAGLIDVLQFTEVILTSFGLCIMIRITSKHKQGLCYMMEGISIISGITWMVINVLFLLLQYKYLKKIMIDISVLSLTYGLILSIANSVMIKVYRKRESKK